MAEGIKLTVCRIAERRPEISALFQVTILTLWVLLLSSDKMSPYGIMV